MNITLTFLSGLHIPIHIPKYDFDVPVHISLAGDLLRKIEEYKYYNYSQFSFYVPEIDLCINNDKNDTFQVIYDHIKNKDDHVHIIVYVQSHMHFPDFYQKYIRMMHEDEFHRPFDDSDFTPLNNVNDVDDFKKYYWINYEKGDEYNMVRFYSDNPKRPFPYNFDSDTLYIANVDHRKATHNNFCDHNENESIRYSVYTEIAKQRFAIILHLIENDYPENNEVVDTIKQFLTHF